MVQDEVEMNKDLIELIATLRTAVGLLGETASLGYWSSGFFSKESPAFLDPVFPRTRFLACVNGVAAAATRAHDERIGVGHVYHLFRLPEDIEQSLQRSIADSPPSVVLEAAGDESKALAALQQSSEGEAKEATGPTRVGTVDSMTDLGVWRFVAGHYLAAFENGREVFPYFAGDV